MVRRRKMVRKPRMELPVSLPVLPVRKPPMVRVAKVHGEGGTNIERLVQKMLDDLGIAYKQHHALRGHFKVDFFIPHAKTVIECDGCYYHACPDCKPDHIEKEILRTNDIERTKKLERAGFKVHRFWGCEIERHPFRVFARLEPALAQLASHLPSSHLPAVAKGQKERVTARQGQRRRVRLVKHRWRPGPG